MVAQQDCLSNPCRAMFLNGANAERTTFNLWAVGSNPATTSARMWCSSAGRATEQRLFDYCCPCLLLNWEKCWIRFHLLNEQPNPILVLPTFWNGRMPVRLHIGSTPIPPNYGRNTSLGEGLAKARLSVSLLLVVHVFGMAKCQGRIHYIDCKPGVWDVRPTHQFFPTLVGHV
jgi:hypothetical protein